MMQNYQPALETAARHALAYIAGLNQRPVAPTAGRALLLERLNRPLAEDGVAAGRVIDELVQAVDGGIVGSAGGRFFAGVIGGALPSAVAADWLTAAWDQNGVLYWCSPAAAAVEETTGEWLKQILRLPAEASFAFVSGCQMAHLLCLAAARHALLQRSGWDVEERGLWNAPRMRLISGDHRHGAFERAVRLLGFGTANVEYLPVDSEGRLAPDTLAQALDRDPSAPAIVLLQAGEINTGSFDPFAHLIPIARRSGAWVHVDGAFGLWAAASPRFRHLVQGVELADSWATDGHKWLNVPFGSGYAFIAHPEAHRACVSHRAVYLTHDVAGRDPIDWNPEWSRRARAFSTYAALRELGRCGVADLIERCCAHAQAIVEGIGRLPGTEVLWKPVINQGLVRFLDPSGGDHDRRTDAVIAAVTSMGEAFFGGTTWRGKRAMRVSVCNWQTSCDDVERVIRAVGQVLRA